MVKDFANTFTSRLSEFIAARDNVPPRLFEAVRYSLLGPGKRIRPFLIYECCRLAGGTEEDAFPAAAAMEMVHAFSLIHDDLPAMDDDDLRRGRPTNHKVYGEALAILAGDALLALAFETLVNGYADNKRSSALVAELATGAGWQGMIGGQVADIEGENEPPALDKVRYIHYHKTGSLLASSCRMGCLAANADKPTTDRLGTFGLQMGLAFQIADDLLDVTSSTEKMGKKVGKDAQARKQTYPACVGLKESRDMATKSVEEAIAQLDGFGDEANRLRQLATFAATRSA